MQTKDLIYATYSNTALDWTGCTGVRLTGRVAEGGPHASRGHADGADLRLAHGWDGFWQLWHRRQTDSTITWLASGRTRGPRLRRVGVDTPALPPDPHRSALLVTTVNALLKCYLSAVPAGPTAHSVFSSPLRLLLSFFCPRLTFCQQSYSIFVSKIKKKFIAFSILNRWFELWLFISTSERC